jgi:hypothetical protein
MAALHLNDAGTWRRILKVHVNDAGTWRQIRAVYVNDAGTWRPVYSAGYDFTLTANGSAQNSTGVVGKGFNTILNGFTTHGSLSVQPLFADYGLNIWTLYDITSTSEAYTEIAGFSSAPGAGFLSSIENVTTGVTRLASAATYAYLGGGVARWYWTPGPTAWGFVGGGAYNMRITVNA